MSCNEGGPLTWHPSPSQATDREENKQIALGTSKLNYLDPRISVAWSMKHEVPIEKVSEAWRTRGEDCSNDVISANLCMRMDERCKLGVTVIKYLRTLCGVTGMGRWRNEEVRQWVGVGGKISAGVVWRWGGVWVESSWLIECKRLRWQEERIEAGLVRFGNNFIQRQLNNYIQI